MSEEIPVVDKDNLSEYEGQTSRVEAAAEYITRVTELESITSVQAQAIEAKDAEIEGLRGEVARLGSENEELRVEAQKVPDLEAQLAACQENQVTLEAQAREV